MGAWGEGMRANDTALDAIGDLEDRISGKDWRERGDEGLTSEQVQAWIQEHGIEAALSVGRDNWGLLGVADYLLDHGIQIQESQISGALHDEVTNAVYWDDPVARHEALKLFRHKVNGVLTDEQKEKLDRHGRGLFARIAEGCNSPRE